MDKSKEDSIQLVKAVEEDKPFLLQLRKTTMVEHLESEGIFLTDEEHVIRTGENFDCAHVITIGGQRIGLAKYKETVDCLEIMQLQILPEYQGVGIGRRLMESFIETAVSHRKPLTLTVLKQNPAKRLYERLGFNVVGDDEHEFHLRLNPFD